MTFVFGGLISHAHTNLNCGVILKTLNYYPPTDMRDKHCSEKQKNH